MDSNHTTTAFIGKEKYKTLISARQHTLIGDEPEALGGADMGMMPYELLLAALGECTAITLRMYADRKAWDVTDIQVKLNLTEMTPTDKTTSISREIKIIGNISDEQRQRMMQIANACPVHKVLSNPIKIETMLGI
jgi:putative redox protein